MDPDKSAAIASLKPPETKTQLRQALGMFGWFRFIPNFAKHAYVLTKPNNKANSQQDSFRRKGTKCF